MDDLRAELEEEVAYYQRRLDDVLEELRWVEERPENCICDPREWGCVPGLPCSCFTPDPDPDFAQYCKNCEHPVECHKEN